MSCAVSWRTLAVCLGVAAALLTLGGEGRLFYDNIDWRVRHAVLRYAVLRDVAVHPWAFAFAAAAGVVTLAGRALRVRNVALPALACVIMVPALL